MTPVAPVPSVDGPYDDESINLIYQLLFCDRLDLFKQNHTGELSPPWSTLFAEETDVAALKEIAADTERESRIRMLAFNRLRAARETVPARQYLGTIIEVRFEEGLDTLAVFADGRARYLNHSRKLIVVEGTPSPFDAEIHAVIEASQPIVSAIGPWEKERLPPPQSGNIRMTFLVSDGLYFGEGPMKVMQREPLASPLVAAATKLLLKLIG
jgi:hypothetical protein